ncbi:cyclic pyranopterin monophosphate synthase MoaC [Methanogenium sp. S4BF]|uniref:cyclic pyranopterin monophosphate synthase MoaC n=1 Tax=Methanogenium sp. S4BF TaxID=1789226 RepID=UPI002417C645|nr:cyclic pyranopterin monophosphate synthase MoaC [Methanogenium sp. S4BF]WFN35532.1 cyclic pyranopterin monophosphate synthase MoaC [Methanogenium sp. S4BF]
MPEFSHINNDRAYMVDVTEKDDVHRLARAEGRIHLRPETLEAIRSGEVIKGNVLATARIAAIMAVKQTSSLIPMCHPLPVGGVDVDFHDGDGFITAEVAVRTYGRTGVEMEALTGVSVALLTIWDMVKSAEKDENGQYPETSIEGICVTEKRKS